MLNRKQKEYFRKCLTQRLNESLGKARGTLADISELKDRFSDEIDEASFASDTGFTLRMREREARLIEKIRDALDRLEEGTFGFCEECGEDIPHRRLMARPITTLCIQCKKEQEAAEKVKGGPDRIVAYWAQ